MAILGRGNVRCQHCNRQISSQANFCPYCGKPTATGTVACPQCRATVPANATFCPHCRYQLTGDVAPQVQGQRWVKNPDDFAARVEVDDIPGYFRRDLIVEPGTQAVILVNGRNEAGVVGPGRYTLKALTDQVVPLRQAKTLTAILVDVGETPLEFTVSDLLTRDPLSITLDCRVVARVHNAALFLVNFMKGRRTVTRSHLRQYLFDEIQNAAAEAVARYSVAELSGNLALKEELAMHIEAHLMETFKGMGLKFDRVSALNFRHEQWDEIRRVKTEYFLQISKEEAELEGRKRLLDALDEKELLEIAQETKKVARYEQRAQMWARMRRAVLSDRMDEVKSEEDFARFMRQVDRQRLLDQSELEELKHELRERREDRERQRAFLVAKAELEQQYALKMVELARRRDLSIQDLELEQEVARRRLEGEIAIEEKRWTWELRRQREEAEFRRAQEEAERKARLQAMVDQALTQAEIDDLELRALEKELDLGLKALRGMKAVKREDLEETLRIRWEDERRRLDVELQRERQRLELDLQRYREEKAHELKRLAAMATMSAEALIAVTGPDQARLLAELKRTEVLAGMTEDQILALAAKESPEVAKAFQERFRGLSGEELKAMYERMVEAERAAKEEQAQMWRETMQMVERMFGKAVDSQREATTAFARNRGEPPVIVTPGLGSAAVGGSTTAGSYGAARVQVCPNCKVDVPVGTKFCSNCGEKFFD